MKSEREISLENYIKACELSHLTYRNWIVGDIHIRQYQMKLHMKDWVCAEALLHGERRKREIKP